MSGFWRGSPPVDEKLPGVIAAPSGLKKTRRGPSELKDSTGLTLPPLKAFGKELLALTAATLKAAAAAECPPVAPAVVMLNKPRRAVRWRKRLSPEVFTITIRLP